VTLTIFRDDTFSFSIHVDDSRLTSPRGRLVMEQLNGSELDVDTCNGCSR
jgi:hypothetical protein